MTLALRPSDFNLEFRQRPVHALSAPFQKTDPYLWVMPRHFVKLLGRMLYPICGFISTVDSQPNFQTPTQPLQPFKAECASLLYVQKSYHLTDVSLCWEIEEKICIFGMILLVILALNTYVCVRGFIRDSIYTYNYKLSSIN